MFSSVPRSRLVGLCVASLTIGACSSDGGGPSSAVDNVVITAPGTAPTFQTLGRTLQFSAEARRSNNEPIAAATINWSSNNTAVATVSGTGLVTAIGNGTADIRANSSGLQSAPVTVTVAQVANTLSILPTPVQFGALGSTRQLQAGSADSSGAPIPGAPAVTWSALGDGATASVSAGGLVTALAIGSSDTAVATMGAKSAKAPITVTQFPAMIVVSTTGTDTIRTTGRTRTYTADVADSLSNPMSSAGVAWSSTDPSVASVAAGVATAITDGSTNVRATIGTVFGQRPLVVRRYAFIFTLSPPSATITTNGGTQMFAMEARDSADVLLATTWLTRATSIATTAPTTGLTTTVTAAGNGSTYLVVAAGTRTDSAQVTVSGQIAVPLTAGVSVDDFFFRSVLNLTMNPAIDTIAVGGTITWTFGGQSHSVESTGDPVFPSGPIQTGGTLQRTFNAAGTYEYICILHGGMTGRVVVR
jgi:plastocyanin